METSRHIQEAPPLSDKLMFIVIGARDFSPEITVHLIGTKVPCFDKVPPPPNSSLSRSGGGFFQRRFSENLGFISTCISQKKIFKTRVQRI